MTTAAPTTEVLVKNVLDAMQDGAAGDKSALDKLKDLSAKGGTVTAPATPSKPSEKLHTVDKMEIIRPNGETYHVRKLGKHHDVAVLRRTRERNINPLLTGPPGTGKTALLEAAYAEATYAGAAGFYTLQGTGDTETGDFVGGYVQRLVVADDGSVQVKYEWVDGPLLLAMEAGGVLYIDEIALIDPRVLALVYGVMDGRRELRVTDNPDREVVKAQDGFFVVGACNPNAPGARMSEALLSRFRMQFEVTTDYALAKKKGVAAEMVTAAQNMQKKMDSGAMSWAPQFRELMAFKEISDEFGQEFAIRNMVTNAPEMDRSQCADVVSTVFHSKFHGLKLV